MKKTAITTMTMTLVVLFSKFTYAACVVPELPNNLELRWNLFSIAEVVGVDESHGKIKKDVTSFKRHSWVEYHWVNQSGTKIATAKVSDFSWETKVSVYDCEGEKIGTIQENILKDSFKAVYRISNAEGSAIARSTEIDFLQKSSTKPDSMTISNNGSEVVKFRTIIAYRDGRRGRGWALDIYDHNIVDSRLLVMLGAFRVDMITSVKRYYNFSK